MAVSRQIMIGTFATDLGVRGAATRLIDCASEGRRWNKPDFKFLAESFSGCNYTCMTKMDDTSYSSPWLVTSVLIDAVNFKLQ